MINKSFSLECRVFSTVSFHYRIRKSNKFFDNYKKETSYTEAANVSTEKNDIRQLTDFLFN